MEEVNSSPGCWGIITHSIRTRLYSSRTPVNRSHDPQCLLMIRERYLERPWYSVFT